jgi:hypothetical protein
MSAFYDQASLVVVPSGYKSGKIYAQKPLTTDGQLTFTRASTATRVNASGLIETVASGVPRLDYLGSTCPKLLLEPQRTNLRTWSNVFSTVTGWSALTVGGSTVVHTSSYGISPDGTQNADRLQLNLNGGAYVDWISYQAVTVGVTYTYSIYAKSLNGTVEVEILGGTPGGNIKKTIGTSWTRLTHTYTATGTDAYPRFLLQTATTSSSADILVYGCQFEVGSYATSLINTTTAAVTRLADAASKTGISSLIGSTEGTIFFELPPTTFSNTLSTYVLLELDGNIGAGYVHLYKDTGQKEVRLFVRNGASSQCDIPFALVDNTPYKIAAVYKNNRFELWVNGVLRGSDTSGTPASITMNKIQVANDSFNANSQIACSQMLLFKTALTPAQLAELTTL